MTAPEVHHLNHPLIQHKLGTRIAVRKEFAGAPEIRCSPALLNQSYANLLLMQQSLARSELDSSLAVKIEAYQAQMLNQARYYQQDNLPGLIHLMSYGSNFYALVAAFNRLPAGQLAQRRSRADFAGPGQPAAPSKVRPTMAEVFRAAMSWVSMACTASVARTRSEEHTSELQSLQRIALSG